MDESMLAIVVTLNITLALICLGLMLRLLQLRESLRQCNAVLLRAEKKTHRALYRAPYYILHGQNGTQQLRQQIAGLGNVQQQIHRWAAVLGLLRLLGMRRSILIEGLRAHQTSGFKRK
jgi:hypothetical protein